MLSVHPTTKSRRFKFVRFEEGFRKDPIPLGIRVDSKPYPRNTAAPYRRRVDTALSDKNKLSNYTMWINSRLG